VENLNLLEIIMERNIIERDEERKRIGRLGFFT
jgi:hypothetical protein